AESSGQPFHATNIMGSAASTVPAAQETLAMALDGRDFSADASDSEVASSSTLRASQRWRSSHGCDGHESEGGRRGHYSSDKHAESGEDVKHAESEEEVEDEEGMEINGTVAREEKGNGIFSGISYRRLPTKHSLARYRKSLTPKPVYIDPTFTAEKYCSHNYASFQNAVHVLIPPAAPYSVQDILTAIGKSIGGSAGIKDHALLTSPCHVNAKGTHLLEVGLDRWTNCRILATRGLTVLSEVSFSYPPSRTKQQKDQLRDMNRFDQHHVKVLLPRTARWRQLRCVRVTGVRAFIRHLDEAATGAEGKMSHLDSFRNTGSLSSTAFSNLIVQALQDKLGKNHQLVRFLLLGVQTNPPSLQQGFIHCDDAVALVRVYFWESWMIPSTTTTAAGTRMRNPLALGWPSFLRWRMPALTRTAHQARRRADLLEIHWHDCLESCPADRHARRVVLLSLVVMACIVVFLVV
ncbi:hypothetical protein BGZ73_008508, partial [Actinomortierella ambigua]